MVFDRKYIARYFGFPFQDIIKGTDIQRTLNFLRESQYWDETQIYEYQLNKLKRLIDYGSRNVPFYEKQFKKFKLSSNDVKTLDDLQKFPILTKELFRKENFNLISRSHNKFHVKKGKTGGTTGAPVVKYSDVNNRSFTWGSYYRWYEWMGLNYYDRTATFWGARTVLSKSVKARIYENFVDFVHNRLTLDSFSMNETNIKTMFNKLMVHEPLLLKGYLSSLLDFAEFIEDNNLNFIKPKAISTTSETLLSHNRKFLEKVFQAPVFDQYGCGEVAAISYECAKHNGLHINQEHVICEVLDDNRNPIINESGNVIVTDLDNLVMPIIRYENGDLATLTDTKCTCGINQPLMKSVEGRSIDTITLNNGSKVHGVFFSDILFELGISTKHIQKFQIYQDTPGQIEFRIENKNNLHIELEKILASALERFFDKISINKLEKLPHEDNGKFKYIINRISLR